MAKYGKLALNYHQIPTISVSQVRRSLTVAEIGRVRGSGPPGGFCVFLCRCSRIIQVSVFERENEVQLSVT